MSRADWIFKAAITAMQSEQDILDIDPEYFVLYGVKFADAMDKILSEEEPNVFEFKKNGDVK